MEEAKKAFENAAQVLTEHLKAKEGKVGARFPRGFIRPLNAHISRWPYLSDDRQRTVACVIQLCDINRWNLNIWDIGLTAGTVWEWHCSLPVIAVIETLIYEFGVQMGFFKEGTRFEGSINIFVVRCVIDKDMSAKLHSLRRYRNEMHLRLKDEVEMHDGKPRMYNESVRALHAVETRLNEYWKVTKR